MKYLIPFLTMLMFFCFGIYGLWNSEQLQQEEIIQSSQTALNDLQDSIRALQNNVATLQDSVKNALANDPDLDLQKRIDFLEKEVVLYQNHYSQTVNDYNDKMSIWLAIMTIILAIIAIGGPYLSNKWSEKNIEKLLKDADIKAGKAQTKANKAVKSVKKYAAFAEKNANVSMARCELAEKHANTAKEQANDAEKEAAFAEQHAKAAKEQADLVETKMDSVNNLLHDLKDHINSITKTAKDVEDLRIAIEQLSKKQQIVPLNNLEDSNNLNGQTGDKQEAEKNDHQIHDDSFNDIDMSEDKKMVIDASKNEKPLVIPNADKIEKAKTDEKNIAIDNKTITADAQSKLRNAEALHYYLKASQESDKNTAFELFNKCIIKDPNFAEAYNDRGFLRLKIGGPDAMKAAMDDYTTAITLFENQGRGIYAEAYNNRGVLYFDNNNLKESEDDFKAAISIDNAEAYLYRGLLNYKNGKTEEAGEDFNKAINKKSNFAEAFYIRGLWRYCGFEECNAINDIILAKSIKNDVVETLAIRSLLTDEMKDYDNSINEVKYSNDLKKLIQVPNDKKAPFFILNCVTKIGESAFKGCENLSSINIPDWVTEIGNFAFDGCTSLTSVEIPEKVNKIGKRAFSCCTNLKEINVDKDNPNYCSKDGILFSKDMSRMIAVPGGIASVDITIYNVTEIGRHAFQGCTSLISIKIPHGVIKIGDSAFFGCTKLASIEISETVTEIGRFVFEYTQIRSIVIPDNVTKIGNGAFFNCNRLIELHLRHKKLINLSDSFSNDDLSTIKLYVPKEAENEYRNDPFYSQFGEIKIE